MRIARRAVNSYSNKGLGGLLAGTRKYLSQQFIPAAVNNDRPKWVWAFTPVYNRRFERQYGRGVDVMREDWDTLVLLDACRYDDFEHVNKMEGELKSKISRGADSPQFIQENFQGRSLHDTVYVTANPHVTLLDNDVFYAVDSTPIESWDDEIQCIPPNAVTRAAIDAHNRYPNKRIICHYMQPHDPPLGQTGTELRDRTTLRGPNPSNENDDDGARIMEAVAEGDVPLKLARKAYRETLEIVLEEVEELLSEIEGKVVLSSDHGEMFGEQPYRLFGQLYEHYRNPKTIELCKVPWFVPHEEFTRRSIRSDEPDSNFPSADNDLNRQLEALGYR